MDTAELLMRLEKYGADIAGINGRFMGDGELYERCFREFLDDPNFDALKRSVAAHDGNGAFEAAHALKGLSGNIGVTPFYFAVCELVEALRGGKYKNTDALYAAVVKQRLILKGLLSDTPDIKDASEKAPASARPKTKPARAKKRKALTKKDKIAYLSLPVLLAAVIVVCVLFGGLVSNYRSNTMEESAAHLTEIEQELQLYIEARIDGDWRATHSIANSIVSGGLTTDAEMFEYIRRERDIWGVSDITIYTESGYAVSTDGGVLPNDTASDMAATAHRSGEYLTVRESSLIYMVPVNTEVQYHGSAVIAVSVLHDLSTFLDGMQIKSFGGEAYLYLTQSNGTVISKLTHTGSENVYNLLTLLQKSELRSLSDGDDSAESMFTSETDEVFLRKTDSGDQYIVCAPIETGYSEMRLFYFAPVSAVNRTTDSFSRYITILSAATIFAFAAIAAFVSMYLYKARRRQFDRALTVREHMLDMLVKNSKSAFALLSVGQTEPLFRSGNFRKIFGESFYNLEKTDTGYRMLTETGSASAALAELNAQLSGWDGKSEFRSTFIRNPSSPVPAYYEVQLFPVEEDESGEDYIGIAQDVTPLYERQAAAAEALVMAERANLAKSRFLSNMSHDIRTPMNAIVNMTEFAAESAGEPEKQKEYLDELRESSAHLLSLINDVLDMSRIESGQITLASAPFDLKAELRRITDITRPLFDGKKQSFTAELDALPGTVVKGDRLKLSQVLINLLSNAGKFTPEGGSIRFSAECIPSIREDTETVRFRVTDTGIGISRENMEKIFEPFSRADDETVSKTEGTGLGLSICRSYVTAMCGTITCESEPGEGSTFTVELPFEKADGETENSTGGTETAGISFAGKRCLLCEDNQVNRMIAEKLLRRLGFTVETACNGREGADMFIASPSGYYDVIYMDVRMPVADGYTATGEIRHSAHPQAETVPIIAMTANVFAEDIEKARMAGMNGHLGKPILINELIKTTDSVLGHREEKS